MIMCLPSTRRSAAKPLDVEFVRLKPFCLFGVESRESPRSWKYASATGSKARRSDRKQLLARPGGGREGTLSDPTKKTSGGCGQAPHDYGGTRTVQNCSFAGVAEVLAAQLPASSRENQQTRAVAVSACMYAS